MMLVRTALTATRTFSMRTAMTMGVASTPIGTTLRISGTPTARSRSSFPKVSSFLRLLGGVLFYELSIPTSEHTAYFIYRGRKHSILLSLKRSSLPKY